MFKKAVPLSALEWMMRENGKFPELANQIDELIHWGLIIKLEEDKEQALYQVHRLVKDFIQTQTDEAQRKTWLVQAAGFYEDIGNVWDLLDARELYFDAEEFNQAGNLVADVQDSLRMWGFMELVKSLNEQTIATASDAVKAMALHNLGNLYYVQGDYPQALEKYNRSLKIAEELGNKGGIAESLGQIGKLYQEKGDYRGALSNFLLAFSTFKALNSPNLNIVGSWINKLKEKVGEETFNKYYQEIMAEQGGRVE